MILHDEPSASTLRSALADERPQPVEFRANVLRRIAEREADRTRASGLFARAPELARRAAAILPPATVPAALKLAGLGSTKLGWKALPGLAAIPAVSLLMLVLTFAAVLRGFWRAPNAGVASSLTSAEVVASWWRRNWIPAVVGFVLIGVLVLARHPETAVVLVLLSMVAAALLLGELARAGLADRRQVGSVAGQLLWNVGLYWFLFRDLIGSGSLGVSATVAPLLLSCAGAVCFAIGHSLKPARVWDWLLDPIPMGHPDPITTSLLRVLSFGAAFVASLVVLIAGAIVVASLAPPGPAHARVEAWIESFDGEPSSWGELERACTALGTERVSELDLDAVRGAIPAEWSSLSVRAQELALRLGLASPTQIQNLASSPRAERLLQKPETANEFDGPRILALLSSGALDDARRARLLEGLLEDFPSKAELDALEKTRRRARLLDELGARRELESRAAAVRALVARHWDVPYRGRRASGGFVASVEHRINPGFLVGHRLLFDADSTFDALGLIDRFGAPESVDLQRVREAVLADRSAFGRFGLAGLDTPLLLLELEGIDELPPPTLWQAVVRLRVTLGALLLALLCVFAVLRSPRATEEIA